MMETVSKVLKEGTFMIPKCLLYHYHELNLEEKEVLLLIYLLPLSHLPFNSKQISQELKEDLSSILDKITTLSGKGILKIEQVKKGNIREEYLSLDPLYEKLAFLYTKPEEAVTTNLFDLFEKEFGRTLSPMEYEIINSWKQSNLPDDLIVLALKEAVYNGVSNLRYIDKIIYDWQKKGIRTKEAVEKEKTNWKQKKEEKKELFEYDWLNDKDE